MARLSKAEKFRRAVEAERARFPKLAGAYYTRPQLGEGFWSVEAVTKEGRKVRRRIDIGPSDTSETFVLKVEAMRRLIEGERSKTEAQTFESLIDQYCIERELKPNSVLSFKTALKGFSMNDKANLLRVEEIRITYAEGSARMKIQRVSAFYKWLKKKGIECENPTREIHKLPPKHHRTRVFTEDEMNTLMTAVDSRNDERFSLFVRLLRYTAARCSTIEAMTSHSWDGSCLKLTNVKGGRDYDVELPIHDEMTKGMLNRLEDNGELLFTRREAVRLRRLMSRLFAPDNNGERLSPHSLRHHAATTLYRAGVPIDKISKVLQHKNISTTLESYAHLTKDDLSEIMRKL